jgi:uncharacterized tellurite resistance protein B-like protein
MSFLRFLNRDKRQEFDYTPASTPADLASETQAVRDIVSRLQALPADRARFLAVIAYVLARSAYSDMQISDVETTVIERELTALGLDQAQAALVAEMAKLQEVTIGGTSDFTVTREFQQTATPEQCAMLLRACYRVCAADDSISGYESATLDQIANELKMTRADAAAIRAEFADKLSARFGFGKTPGA